MVRGFLLGMLIFFSAAGILTAKPVTVVYLEGSAKVSQGTSWRQLDFGDEFDSAAPVLLSPGATLELAVQGGQSILLVSPGTYVLDSMNTSPGGDSAARLLGQKMRQLLERPANLDEGTVGGVRGSDAAADTVLLWGGASLEAALLETEAADALKAGDHVTAWTRYLEAAGLFAEDGDSQSQARCAWQAAMAGAASASRARMLAALESADPASAGAVRADYVLLLAALYVGIGQAERAEPLLSAAIREGWLSSEQQQEARDLLPGN